MTAVFPILSGQEAGCDNDVSEFCLYRNSAGRSLCADSQMNRVTAHQIRKQETALFYFGEHLENVIVMKFEPSRSVHFRDIESQMFHYVATFVPRTTLANKTPPA